MTGSHSNVEIMQNWYLQELNNARRMLAEFEHLDQLFEGFRGYEAKKYSGTKSIILHCCLPWVGGGIKTGSIKTLLEVEDALIHFDVIAGRNKKLEELKTRLTRDGDDSLSAYTELIIANRLAKRSSRHKVELYPKINGGKISDCLVSGRKKSVYLEIGNLSESIPEKSIQKILEAGAAYLGKKVGVACYLKISVDTAELVFDDKGHIDVKQSISKLTSELDTYQIHGLAGYKGLFSLHRICEDFRSYEAIKHKRHSTHSAKMLRIFEDPVVKQWVSNCGLGKLGVSKLIKIIQTHPSSTLLTEIHAEGIYPSRAANAEIQSHLNHIMRNIERQVKKEEQVQPNAPNIIVLWGDHWTVSQTDGFALLQDRIKKFFMETKNDLGRYVSGIAIFDVNFNCVLYVPNKYAAPVSKLRTSYVKRLGFL